MKKPSSIIIIIVLIILVIILISTCLFIVEEGFQAITLRFGKIEHIYTEAGLKFKFPWDNIKIYSKKILSWNGKSDRIPTEQSEAQFIYVDTTARWKIVDAKRFYESLGDREEALKKLDDIVDSSVRTIISNNLLLEAVRSTKTPIEFSIEDFTNISTLAASILRGEQEEVLDLTVSAQSTDYGITSSDDQGDSNVPYNPVSRYIYTNYLSNALKAQLIAIKDANALNKRQESILVDLFNTLLKDQKLYDKTRFANIVVIAYAKSLIEKKDKTEQEMLILNRLLLEAAYPQNIIVSPVKKGREALSREMVTVARNSMIEKNTEDGSIVLDKNEKPVNRFGIELIDIVIRQIKYSDDLKESVYQRMIKERNQIAEKTRSEGIGEKNKILGKLANDVKQIQSKAFREAEEIKGKADAEATRVYAETYEKNREFFKFWRSLESYKTLLPKFKKTLSTDADYFDYLYNQLGK